MALFNVNFPIMVWQNIPVQLRENTLYSWLKCLAAPVIYIYNLFMANRANNLYRLAHTGQVCSLEAALNDTFDNTLRRIYITNGPFEQPVYCYLAAEDLPVYIDLASEAGTGVIPPPDPVPLFLVSETVMDGLQFIVNVPAAAAAVPGYSVARLSALVNTYRLPAKGNYAVVAF